MNLPEVLKPFEDQIESILVYAKGVNFDFENMTRETLKEMLKGWLEMGRKLTIDIERNIDVVAPMIRKSIKN